ncbi:parallel beta-helix repeat (two copies) [Fulvimarina manganoxydans]|uniref:Parallel beta-helix repeat (Two copies) n=1 Tax=Fulvimarina manganoxydans TaxID=937218 RepID=A0A1W2ETZ7_9HYPH|nr:tandem-95 repeat protein [Fulvimarina manganoxydans]SMD13131.1 parallel beta-helix repeat (two copies) [Fulvimarina manganoxydans]
MAGTFNVTDYGATANDATDDSASIQAAIDAAYAAGGGTVVIPKGLFWISADPNNPSAGAVEVRSNVTLLGAGIGETVLKLVDNFDERINGILRTPVNESAENVVMRDFTIDGNRANNTGHQTGFITGVKENDDGRVHKDIVLDHVEVRDCTAYGIDPHEITYDLVVSNCIASGNGTDGIVADFIVGGVFENNISFNNDRHGFNITTSSTDLLIKDNYSYDNGSTGLVVQRGDIFPDGEDNIDWPSDLDIIGGEYYGNAREGMLIKLSDSVNISGVKIYENLRQGIRIEGASNTVIDGNEIYNNSQESSGAYDEINIRLRVDTVVSPERTYYSTDTYITNNTIYSDGPIVSRYGIREESSNTSASNPSGTRVADNDVSGSSSGDYSIPPYSATEGNDFLPGTTSGDVFRGLGGSDLYVINHSQDVVYEDANAGHDVVISSLNFTLPANVEDLMLVGAAIRGTGNGMDNFIVGNSLANELEGLDGQDILDGFEGTDILNGGDGNDIYYVDNVGDRIIEKDHAGAGGIDTVYSSVSYTLADQVENLKLTGTADLDATGNTEDNELVGNSGANRLDGQSGADVMTGLGGDDSYYVDHTGDVLIEEVGGGTDTVYSVLSYSLGANLENLVLLGADNRDGIGNSGSNRIVGNAGDNKLHGGSGDDRIEGGLGLDSLYGDGGEDVFILRKDEFEGDVVEDYEGAGANGGDRLLFVGFSDQAQLVQLGNGYLKVFDGDYTESFRIKNPAGIATLTSEDYSFGEDAGLEEPDGPNSDPVAAQTGNSVSGQEDNTINGQLPVGNDPDIDTSLTYALVSPMARLTLEASGAFVFNPAPNAFGNFDFDYVVVDSLGARSAPQTFVITVQPVNDAPTASLTGNSAIGTQDVALEGQVPTGTDVDNDQTLTYELVAPKTGLQFDTNGRFLYTPEPGYSGSFTFDYRVVDSFGAQSDAQTFSIYISPSTPAVNFIDGTSSRDTLIGTPGNDVIDGKASRDTMSGLAGNDVYYVDSSGDEVLEQLGEGFDQVFATSSFALNSASEVEEIIATGSSEVTLRGNGFSNILTGNNANNSIYGNGGPDIIDGRGGADRLFGGEGDDIFILRKGEIEGDVLRDFAGNGSGTADRIIFVGFSAEATLVALGRSNYKVVDGSSEALFSISNVSSVSTSDYTFETSTPSAGQQSGAPSAASSGNTAMGMEDRILSGQLPPATDPDGDVNLSYVAVSQLDGLVLNPNGSFTYTPQSDYNGQVVFRYQVVDSTGLYSESTSFEINLQPEPDAPFAAILGNATSGEANTTISGRIPAGSDPDGDTALTYGLASPVAGLSLGADGQFHFTPAQDFVGDVDFSYYVIDSTNLTSDPQAYRITVIEDTQIGPGETGQTIIGTSGADVLVGTPGDDIIDGGTGGDTMTGGAGDDIYYVDSSSDVVVENTGEGTDSIYTTSSVTLNSNSNVEIVVGFGTSQITIKGNGYSNVLIGNEANNMLVANGGGDVLNGGFGNDLLKLGSGADTVVFDTALGAGNVDRVQSFQTGIDSILLDISQFAGLSEGALAASQFHVGGSAADVQDRILYDSGSGSLFFDADGAGGQMAIQFAQLDTGLSLSASDFRVESYILFV